MFISLCCLYSINSTGIIIIITCGSVCRRSRAEVFGAVCGTDLLVGLQDVGAVSPLGQDDGRREFSVQASTLGGLCGRLRGGVVVLEKQENTSHSSSHPGTVISIGFYLSVPVSASLDPHTSVLLLSVNRSK